MEFRRCECKSLLVLFFISILWLIRVKGSCEVGEGYEDSNVQSRSLVTYSASKTYLNLETPATCTGYVFNITFCYLKLLKSTNQLNPGTFSLWEPSSTFDYYRKINSSEGEFAFRSTGCPNEAYYKTIYSESADMTMNNTAQEVNCRVRCFGSPVLVRPGYVLGLEVSEEAFDSSKAELMGENTNQDIGLCVSDDSKPIKDGSIRFICDNSSVYTNRTLFLEAIVNPINCPQLKFSANFTINSTDVAFETTISFSCVDDRHIMRPSLVLTCLENGWNTQTGVWNGDIPPCFSIDCMNPGAPRNGSTSGLSYTNGSTLKFECDNGYYLSGAERIQCFEGTWSAPNPNCIQILCHTPGSPENGHLIYSNTFPVNSTAKFVCEEDFKLSYSYLLLCLPNGTWNGSIPMCLPIASTDMNNTSAGNNGGDNSSNNNNDRSDDGTGGFLVLIVLIILVLFVVFICTVCVLFILLTRKRSHKQKDTDDATINSLRQLLLDQNAGNDISPYSVVSMPLEMCSVTPNGIVYQKNQYATPSQKSFNSPPPTPQQFHYETENVLRDLEQSLMSETPYWTPGEVEDELYLQLNSIRVKTIPNADLRILEDIGSGEFAKVSKGLLQTTKEDVLPVAVKAPKDPLLQQEDKIRFLQEAAIMGQFHHSNVLKLLGVVTDMPERILVIVELMEKGDLLSHLKSLKSQTERETLPSLLLSFCRQICLGMTYLSGKGFVHRDLAARNILVSQDNICKIADFGMSRDLKEENYYLVHEGALIPVKWTAPEAIRDRKYSSSSDVWGYGCVVYEIWSLGCKPFEGATTLNTLKILKTGQRLAPPPGCPRQIYQLMINAWHPDPKKRPNFNDMMLSLLTCDKDILLVPKEECSRHPEAGILGSDLQAGVCLYKDLQESYTATVNV